MNHVFRVRTTIEQDEEPVVNLELTVPHGTLGMLAQAEKTTVAGILPLAAARELKIELDNAIVFAENHTDLQPVLGISHPDAGLVTEPIQLKSVPQRTAPVASTRRKSVSRKR